MRTVRALFLIGMLAQGGAGCGSLPSSITINLEDSTQDVNVIVRQTFQAMTAAAAAQPPHREAADRESVWQHLRISQLPI